jgi:hypothetical protein
LRPATHRWAPTLDRGLDIFYFRAFHLDQFTRVQKYSRVARHVDCRIILHRWISANDDEEEFPPSVLDRIGFCSCHRHSCPCYPCIPGLDRSLDRMGSRSARWIRRTVYRRRPFHYYRDLICSSFHGMAAYAENGIWVVEHAVASQSNQPRALTLTGSN